MDTYRSTQEVKATQIDLRFSFQVLNIIDYLDEFGIEYLIRKYSDTELLESGNGQAYQLQLAAKSEGEDEDVSEKKWIGIEHDTWLIITPGEDGEMWGLTVLPSHKFLKTYQKVKDVPDLTRSNKE